MEINIEDLLVDENEVQKYYVTLMIYGDVFIKNGKVLSPGEVDELLVTKGENNVVFNEKN